MLKNYVSHGIDGNKKYFLKRITSFNKITIVQNCNFRVKISVNQFSYLKKKSI